MQSQTYGRTGSSFTHPKLTPEILLTLSYLSLSILWILLSDFLAAKLAGHNEEALQMIQAIKGIFFVLLSGSFLFLLSHKLFTRIRKSSLQKKDIETKFIALNETVINTRTNKSVRLAGNMQDINYLRTKNDEQELNHKRTLASSIIRAQENERNRWAEELHDNVCQLLTVANMYASDICLKPERAGIRGPELKKIITKCINELRQLSATIKTPSFTEETLLQTLKDLAANINRVNTIHFAVDDRQFNESKLCGEQKLMVYRVVQEQMNNIVKYAEAKRVEVQLTMNKYDEVKISVKDDGKGFDTVKIKTGIGLRNIQSRLQVYGGRMKIQSAPGQGCTLLAFFNIFHEEKKPNGIRPLLNPVSNEILAM